MVDIKNDKKLSGEFAANFITSGMVVGLGHGSTAIFALHQIAENIHRGTITNIFGIPCSKDVERDAEVLGIPLSTLKDHPSIDITIDGADEVDPELNLIKGGGGALLREKIVAQASQREIIVIDYSKKSLKLGTNWAIPVEVIPFGWETQKQFLESLGAQTVNRRTIINEVFITDHGNFILDCDFGPIDDLNTLASNLNSRAGIVEHGLFLGIATDVIISRDGVIEHLQR
jgi:ribose 5-phosphate isomerase A